MRGEFRDHTADLDREAGDRGGERGVGKPPARPFGVLTTFDLDEYVVDAFRSGASGFLLKTAPPAQLVAAVRTVHAGDALLAPASTRRLIEQYARPRGESYLASAYGSPAAQMAFG